MSTRGMPVTKAIRAGRRKVAEEMQAEYEKLTTQQKIDKLPPAPGAARQRARLEAQLQKELTGKQDKLSTGLDVSDSGGSSKPNKSKKSKN